MRSVAETLLVLLIGAVITISAAAAEIEGVKLADKLRVSDAGPELILNGAGVRTRVFFKVYVGALYLQKKENASASTASVAFSFFCR